MSRGQSTQAFNTAAGNQATNENEAQSQFGATQNSIGNYNNQLASFVSGNPYTQGGEYDKTINAGLANTSNAGSNSLKGALQSQALRTGQNSAADAATAASAANTNTQNLSSQEAAAQQQRINSESGYNTTALQASTEPISANQSLYGTATGAAQGNLGTEEGAAQTPSFWDEVGNGLAGGLGKALGNTGGQAGPVKICWIAEAIYGFDDPRTHLVRAWLNLEYAKTFPGNFIMGLYGLVGRQVAWCARRSRILRLALTPLFEKALRCAQGWSY